jgi:hypothetical protein
LLPCNSLTFVTETEILELKPQQIDFNSVGQKTFGLLSMPSEWTLPFFGICELAALQQQQVKCKPPPRKAQPIDLGDSIEFRAILRPFSQTNFSLLDNEKDLKIWYGGPY